MLITRENRGWGWKVSSSHSSFGTGGSTVQRQVMTFQMLHLRGHRQTASRSKEFEDMESGREDHINYQWPGNERNPEARTSGRV